MGSTDYDLGNKEEDFPKGRQIDAQSTKNGIIKSIGSSLAPNWSEIPIIATDMPVMFEDEGQEEMGESEIHLLCDEIARNGIKDHLAGQRRYRVFSNLNVYYNPVVRWAYISPDTMVVETTQELPEFVRSYRIGVDGPPPILALEVLSRRSFQQQDLTNKPVIYADLNVAEYILVDMTGEFLPERLLLKRLKPTGDWEDLQDPDGGVTSALGFRLIIDTDGQLRVANAATGKRYLRPRELNEVEEARQLAEERVRALEEELARLRGKLGGDLGQK